MSGAGFEPEIFARRSSVLNQLVNLFRDGFIIYLFYFILLNRQRRDSNALCVVSRVFLSGYIDVSTTTQKKKEK